MTDVVTRAIRTWSFLFDKPLSEIVYPNGTCSELSKFVKTLLGSCTSSVEEEVMAYQSVKKLLPASCKCMESDLIRKVASNFSKKPRTLPKGYVRFARSVASQLFPVGWDSNRYEQAVCVASPSMAGTTDFRRSEGGGLGANIDHEEYIKACLEGIGQKSLDISAELIVVQSAGKPRPLTKFSSETLIMKPLHKCIYDHLSTKKFLARGDVTNEMLHHSGFTFVDGEVYTSGDYASATDGLSIEVAETILSAILKNCRSVPDSIRREALRLLRPEVYNLGEGIDLKVTVGQMMGSFLSFPLLCLQNYVAFRFSAKEFGGSDYWKSIPILINGDDILFRSSKEFSSYWMDMVGRLGLEVERTKTSVTAEFGTLNSTLLRPVFGWLKVIRTFRFGMLKTPEYVTSLSDTYDSFIAGQTGDIRYRGACAFFSWHINSLKSVRYTTLELGFRGRLALRVTRKFGLRICESVYRPPAPPVEHNVILSSDSVTFVQPESVPREVSVMNAREMASWKFSIRFARDFERAKLDYFLALSMVRPDEPDFLPYTSGVGLGCHVSPPSLGKVSRWFVQPRLVSDRGFPLFHGVREFFEGPPPYSEFDPDPSAGIIAYGLDPSVVVDGVANKGDKGGPCGQCSDDSGKE